MVAIVLAFIIQALIAKPYEIPTDSMVPTIQPNDRVIANRVVYRFRSIERGDIIVFSPPPSAIATCAPEKGVPFVKRVIGLPGDVVTVEDGVTRVNGKVYQRARRGDARVQHDLPGRFRRAICSCWATTAPTRATRTSGSTRRRIRRSTRSCPQKNVIGQAEIIYWPLSRISFLN